MRILKRLLKILLWTILVVVLLFTSVYYGIQTEPVQNFLIKRVTNFLSDEWKTTVRVGHIKIKFIKKVEFADFYVEDLKHDTLLFAPDLVVNFGIFSYKMQKISISSIELTNGRFKLKKYPDMHGTSLQFIIDYFEGTDTTHSTNKGWDFKLESGIVHNTTFSYTHTGHHDTTPELNFNDIYLTHLNGEVFDFIFAHDSTYMFAKNLSFHDKCGLNVKSLTANFSIDETFMRFQNIHLVTKQSDIVGGFKFEYTDYDAFDEFNDSIKMNVDLHESKIGSEDIKYFAYDLDGFNKTIQMNGKIKGTVRNLKGKNLDIRYGDNSQFKGNVSINGLPDIDQTYFDLMIDEFKTNTKDVESIPLAPFEKGELISLPDDLEKLKTVSFKGKFTGFYSDFVTYGNFKTALGNLNADLNLKIKNKSGEYSGHLSTDNFDVGTLFNISDVVTTTTFNVSVKGSGFNLNNIQSQIDGNISALNVNRYNYRNISVNGNIAKQLFTGKVNIDEPNVKLAFLGNIDFNKKMPLYDFKANFEHVKLAKLNLVDRDTSASFSSSVDMLMTGSTLDNMRGSISMTNVEYSENEHSLKVPDVDFYADDNSRGGRNFVLKSTLADIDIAGATAITNAFSSLQSNLSKYIPLVPTPSKIGDKQKFDYNIKLNETDSFFSIFVPELHIAPNTFLQGKLNEFDNQFSFKAQSEKVKYQGVEFNELSLNSYSDTNLMHFNSHAKNLIVNDSLQSDNFHFTGSSMRDSANISLNTGLDTITKTFVDVDATLYYGSENNLRLNFLPESFIKSKGRKWQVQDFNSIVAEKNKFRFENFRVYSDSSSSIELNGIVSSNKEEKLAIIFDEFELYYLKDIFKVYNLDFGGVASGAIELSSITDNPVLNSDLHINNFSFFADTIGETSVLCKYNPDEHNFLLNAFAERDGAKRITLEGEYIIRKNGDYMDFKANLIKTNISVFAHYLTGLAHDLKGSATGEISIIGLAKDPDIKGKILLQKGSFIGDYLNTRYTFTHEFTLDEKNIYFKNLILSDDRNHNATVNGTIYHDHLRTLEFDLNIDATNFKAFDTKAGMNDMFYGTAYASGNVKIKGTPDLIAMDMKIKTEKETEVNIPLTTPHEVGETGFISFINSADTSKKIAVTRQVSSNNFALNLDLNVTPDATVRLIFDQKIGDIIKGTGSGILNMKITPEGTFTMTGDYIIQDGDYLFTMQNVLGKYFTMQKGGTIKWSGDPYAANVDISAKYTKNVGLYDLLQDTSQNYKKKVPVDVVLNLKNNLFNPDINFDIVVHNIDASTQTQVDRYLNAEDEKLRQVMSLIVFNKFAKPAEISSASIDNSGVPVGATLTEFVSKQLSNWASQINRNFNVDLNYTPGDALTQEQYEVAMSTKVLNDRLSIYTSFDFGSQEQNRSASYVVGDFIVEYDLSPDGRIKLKAFNKSNSNNLITTNNAYYTQGLGFAFRKDFNSWRDVFKKKKNN